MREPEIIVRDLKEGQEYQFRVKAVNEVGPGAPSTASEPIVAEKLPGWSADNFCSTVWSPGQPVVDSVSSPVSSLNIKNLSVYNTV